MAGTIIQGNVSTEEQLGPTSASVSEGEKIVDMDERIRLLRPDESQFTTMTSRVSSRAATREKVNWLEEEDFPRIVTNTTAQLATDTAIPLTAGQGKIVQANDLLRNMRTGEGVRVASVATDTVTVARAVGAIGGGNGIAVNANDAWLVVADAQPQGSDFPSPRYLQRVLGFNYTQITRTTWGFTATDTSINKYGGREPAKEAVRKGREHKRKWEAIGFFGMRSFAAAVPPENEPRGTAGGMIEFVQTFKQDVNGPLTPGFFDAWVSGPMAYGSQNKVLFASPLFVQNMSTWLRTGMGTYYQPSGDEKVYGVKIDSFISGAFGYRLPVIVKTEWAEFPNTNKGYGTYAFLVDMDYVERRPLQDRDTKLLTDQQPRGKDSYNAEYLCEATYEIANERAHGILFGVTPPP
jgi:hypothetical protein